MEESNKKKRNWDCLVYYPDPNVGNPHIFSINACITINTGSLRKAKILAAKRMKTKSERLVVIKQQRYTEKDIINGIHDCYSSDSDSDKTEIE